MRATSCFTVSTSWSERPTAAGFITSLDLFDAFHPQTILAYGMNGQPLPVGHGAPLRLRVERQIGYKNAKYVNRIEAVDRLDRIGRGKGGFWEDRGYQWYAGCEGGFCEGAPRDDVRDAGPALTSPVCGESLPSGFDPRVDA